MLILSVLLSNSSLISASNSTPILRLSASEPDNFKAARVALSSQAAPASSAMASKASQLSWARSCRALGSTGLACLNAVRLSSAKRASFDTRSSNNSGSAWRNLYTFSFGIFRRNSSAIALSIRVSDKCPIPAKAFAPQTLKRVGVKVSPRL